MLHPARRSPAPVHFDGSGLAIIESHHSDDFFMGWRRDSFPKILFVIAGSGRIHCEGAEMAFRAESLCIVPRNVRHRLVDDPGSPVSLYGICLRPRLFPGNTIPGEIFRQVRVDTGLGRSLLPAVKELIGEYRLARPGSPAIQLSIALRVLGELARRTVPAEFSIPDSKQRVKNALLEMDRSFWRSQDIDSAAMRAGLSRRRFTQLFREVAGESWQGRLTRLRIQHANLLLESTNLPVRAAAFESGFADLAHFHRTFRKVTGMTPAAARRHASGRSLLR